MKIAGLDIGTTGCKCTVFDEHGQYQNKAYREYPTIRKIGVHELDLSVVLDCAIDCIAEMGQIYPDIAGIGVTSLGESFVFTDEEGVPLYPAMLYTDPRGRDQRKRLIKMLGEMHVAEITGLRPHEMYSISKMMWMKENKPEILAQAKHMFEVEDFIIYHLTGVQQVDYSLASRTMAFDISKLDWSDEILEATGFDRSLLSKPVPIGTAAGTIKPDMAAKCHLPEDAILVSVSHDQVSAAIGSGAFDGKTEVDGAGTTECMITVFDEKPDIPTMYNGYYSVVPYVIPGKYVSYAFLYTGGALTKWCVNSFAKQEKKEAKESGVSVYDRFEEEYAQQRLDMGIDPDEPSGLLVLPHFAGAATPYMDNDAKGAIIGLTIDSTVADIYHGCLEGVCYEMYLNYKSMAGTGIHFKKFHATGGGARSNVWMQMKADVFNKPVTTLRTPDAGTVGSAMMTGIAVGIFKDLDDAADHMVEQVSTFEPRQQMHEEYMKIYERYEKLYDAVRPLV